MVGVTSRVVASGLLETDGGLLETDGKCGGPPLGHQDALQLPHLWYMWHVRPGVCTGALDGGW